MSVDPVKFQAVSNPYFTGNEGNDGGNAFAPAVGVGALVGAGTYFGLKSPMTSDQFTSTIKSGGNIAYTTPLSDEESKLVEKLKKMKDAAPSEGTTANEAAKAPKADKSAKKLKDIFGKKEEISVSDYLEKRYGASTPKELEQLIKDEKKLIKEQGKKKSKSANANDHSKLKAEEKRIEKSKNLKVKYEAANVAKAELKEAEAELTKATNKVTNNSAPLHPRYQKRVDELTIKLAEANDAFDKLETKMAIDPSRVQKYQDKYNAAKLKAQPDIDYAGTKAKHDYIAKAQETAKTDFLATAQKNAEDTTRTAALAAKKSPEEAEKLAKAAGKAERAKATVITGAQKAFDDVKTNPSQAIKDAAADAERVAKTKKFEKVEAELLDKFENKSFDKHTEKLEKDLVKSKEAFAKQEAKIVEMEADLALARTAKENGTKIARTSAGEIISKAETAVKSAVSSDAFTKAFETLKSKLPTKSSMKKAGIYGGIALVATYLIAKLAGGSKPAPQQGMSVNA